jgi:hypothetical protein
MCDVSSTAVFCSEFIEHFAGVASKFFFKPFVAVPVAPVATGMILHLMVHILCISIHKLINLIYFLLAFA